MKEKIKDPKQEKEKNKEEDTKIEDIEKNIEEENRKKELKMGDSLPSHDEEDWLWDENVADWEGTEEK